MSKAIISSLYDSDVFRMACRQFDKAADAYGRVVAFLSSLGDSRSWPRRGMTPGGLP